MNNRPAVRWIFLAAACLGGLLYLAALAGSLYEAVTFPRTPQHVTLAQAVQRQAANRPDFWVFDRTQYVAIRDAVWECASLRQSGYRSLFSDKRRTEAVFTDAQKTAVVFVGVKGFFNCQELGEMTIAGELQRLDERPIQYLSDAGPVVIQDRSQRAYRLSVRGPGEAAAVPVILALLPAAAWALVRRWKAA